MSWMDDAPPHEIRLERHLHARPDRVWRAWTSPEQLGVWWGPDGFHTETQAFELCPGGEWRFVMVHPEHGRFDNIVRFTAVEPARRLSYDQGNPDGSIQFSVEVTFDAEGDGTRLRWRSVFPDAAMCRTVVEQYGAVEGGRQTVARLAEHVEVVPSRTGRGWFRVAGFAVSADGYGAGPDQSLQDPLGKGGRQLHSWYFPTATFRKMHGDGLGGTTGVDDRFAQYGFEGVGAWILGRNMFGPVRGPWPDESWRGWWGEEPPYHVPVFVLTNHPRAPLEMAGGTTFHFVTGGLAAALARAREAAGPQRDVRLGGGVATVRQAIAARLLDELHVAVVPTLLGSGEALWAGLDLPALGYKVDQSVLTEHALHLVLRREGSVG